MLFEDAQYILALQIHFISMHQPCDHFQNNLLIVFNRKKKVANVGALLNLQMTAPAFQYLLCPYTQQAGRGESQNFPGASLKYWLPQVYKYHSSLAWGVYPTASALYHASPPITCEALGFACLLRTNIFVKYGNNSCVYHDNVNLL